MSIRSDATQRLALTGGPNYNAAYTITGWFKCEDAATKRYIYMFVTDDQLGMEGAGVSYTTARKPYAKVTKTSSTRQEGADSISDNTWYFWVLRRASTTSLELRIGTTSETTITTDVTAREGNHDIGLFSGGGDSGSNFKGSMAQARLWTTNLSDSELVTEMNSPTVVKTASLWAEWRMENAAGAGTDSSGNGRNMTVVGTFTTGADDPANATIAVAVPYNRQPLFGPLLAQ